MLVKEKDIYPYPPPLTVPGSHIVWTSRKELLLLSWRLEQATSVINITHLMSRSEINSFVFSEVLLFPMKMLRETSGCLEGKQN